MSGLSLAKTQPGINASLMEVLCSIAKNSI